MIVITSKIKHAKNTKLAPLFSFAHLIKDQHKSAKLESSDPSDQSKTVFHIIKRKWQNKTITPGMSYCQHRQMKRNGVDRVVC